MIKTRNLEILIILVGFLSATESRKHQRCRRTLTTASGTHAPSTLCSGDLIFVDDFDKLDFKKWRHDSTLAGGGVSTKFLFIRFIVALNFEIYT